MKTLYKFNTILINQNGTSFTQHPTGQNLIKIAGEKWLDEMSPNLLERGYMGRRMFWKLFMNYGAIKIIVASQPRIITRNKDLML
jgi:hypothetical protein